MRSNTDVGVRTRERTFEISLVFSKQWTNEKEKTILLLNDSTDVWHYSCGNNSKHLLKAYREPMKTKFGKQQHPSWWTNKILFVFSSGGVLLHVCLWTMSVPCANKPRRDHWMPWSWGYRLCTQVRVQRIQSEPSERALNQRVISKVQWTDFSWGYL